MTEDQFKMQVSPLPDYDYFYYVCADMSLMPDAFCRAYINFIDQSDLFIFTEKFDGYVFVDSKGGEFTAIVEFAPFQRIPKIRPNRKKDPKVDTIESDPYYIAFKEQMEAEILENKTSTTATKQHFFETCMSPEAKESSNTPLLDFVKNRRAERQKVRDEKKEEKRKKDLERRKAKEEQRRTKKEDDTSVIKVLNNQNGSKDKDRSKEKEVKQSFIKKKSDEVKTVKDKTSSEARAKESKSRTGKSYLEERQRQAERREEQRKKLSQSRNSNPDSKSPSTSDDKPIADEDRQTEEKPATSENKGKDSENKKSERAAKREELRKNSYKYDKYESKRDRENDDIKRTRRTNNDRSYQSNRRDEERSEDGGRKRYSESRKGHDSSQRDKYKDKTKIYGQKKTSGSKTEHDKKKNSNETTNKSSCNSEAIDEASESGESKVTEKIDKKTENNELSETNCTEDIKKSNSSEDVGVIAEPAVKPKKYEYKDKTRETRIRRKSLDYDKVRSTSTYSSSKLYSRDKYTEKKRRNSVGSSKQNKEYTELNIDLVDTRVNKKEELLSEKSTIKDEGSKEEKLSNHVEDNVFEKKENPTKEEDTKQEFTDKDRDLPKRRNSTGQRQCRETNVQRRRSSLGSEDKNKVCSFKRDEFRTKTSTKEVKPKDEKKTQRSSRDPRTERRIRNKDRPSIEIYRPGMGKFSKQRLGREKGLGSSTEVDSPSSSPSPTPVLKHKTVLLH